MVDWKKLVGYRKGSEVSRWHTQRPVWPETVGHHSAGVALLCDLISEGQCSRELLYAALIHDLAEVATGDIPTPAKKRWFGLDVSTEEAERVWYIEHSIVLPTLSEDEALLLKACDLLDLCLKAHQEVSLGNQAFEKVYANGVSYLDLLQLPGRQRAMIVAILEGINHEQGE